jgi:hypothetical protein
VMKMFGRFGKKSAAKSDDAPAATVSSPSHTTFLTTSVEVLKLSTEVSAAEVAVPAGFSESK